MQEVSHKTKFVSTKGGSIDYVNDEGEVMASVQVPPGIHRARPYLDACPDGLTVQIASGIVAMPPAGGYAVIPYGPGSHDTGANPDWQPMSNAEQLQRQMRLAVERMNLASDRMERKTRAMASVQRIPQAQPDPVPSEPQVTVVE